MAPHDDSDTEVKPEVAVLTPEEAEELSGYDLTTKMTPFLDRHLIFPILNFLRTSGMYKQDDITRAEIALLSQTNMIDFAEEQYKSLGEQVPAELSERRDVAMEQLQESQERVFPLLQILETEEEQKKISGFKSVSEMCTEFGLEMDIMDHYVTYVKLQYECGDYQMSCELLKHYLSIMEKTENELSPKHVSCTWGALACFLLNKQFEGAAELVDTLDKFFETSGSLKVSKRQVLLQRTWLLHWTLYALFTADNKVEPKLLDYFLNEKSLSIISLSSPYLFRYVAACLILHKRLKHLVKDTVWIIHHEASNYSDPVTRFLLALYTDMDFDEAQRELQKCKAVCQADYFLAHHWPEFEENARLLIFETYCRIHQCINIGMIASKLNMEAEEAELWIVKLIQSAKLDARIDSEKSRVVMSKAPPNVYQQVIEKTKNLSFRSTMLLSNLEKREKDRQEKDR